MIETIEEMKMDNRHTILPRPILLIITLALVGSPCCGQYIDTALYDTFESTVIAVTRFDDWDISYDTDWFLMDAGAAGNFQVNGGRFEIAPSDSTVVVGNFRVLTPQTLGQHVKMEFDYQWLTGSSGVLQIGLYSANESFDMYSVVLADGESAKTTNDHGYFVSISAGGGCSVKRDEGSNGLLDSSIELDSDGTPAAGTTVHHAEVTITKASMGFAIGVVIDQNPALAANDYNPNASMFNQIAIRQTSSSSAIMLDNIKVTSNFRQRGKQWIRTHDFTISGLFSAANNTFHQSLLDCNLNSEFLGGASLSAVNARIAGVPMLHVFLNQSTLNDMTAAVDAFELHVPDGAEAYMICDEPSRFSSDPTKDFDYIGRNISWLQQNYPDKLVFSNAFGGTGDSLDYYGSYNPAYTYQDYLSDFVTVTRPDIMCWDDYPFRYGAELDPTWFTDLTAVRAVAQRNGIPYMGWIQAYYQDQPYSHWRREPSESDMRMQVFSMLTAGCSGYCYYRFLDQSVEPGEFKPGLINSDAADGDDTDNFSAMYYHAQSLSAEALYIGQVLKFLESTDLRFVPGQTAGIPNPTPDGLTNWQIGAGAISSIVSIDVNSADQGDRKDGLIGFFTDDEGDIYFMLTNIYHGGSLSADDATLGFVVEFEDTPVALTKISRFDGAEQSIALSNRTLITTLPGGTGDLYKVTIQPLETCQQVVAANYGMTADFNDDCHVNIADLTVFANSWLDCVETVGNDCGQ